MRIGTEQSRAKEPMQAVASPGQSIAFGILIAIYAAARVLQVYPGRVPMLVIVALHVFPPAIFALFHGARFYGWRGMLVFVAISLVVGNVFENVGVSTGFPYGRYYFTEVMGPKVSVVPILLGLAYVGMAYLSWTLARLILGRFTESLAGRHMITLPLVAAFIMVAWDLSQDPVWATVLRAWIFPGGGAYFGVPLSNFFGWYLTVLVLYQSFALYLRERLPEANPLPPGYWQQAVFFYAVSAAGNLLLMLPQTRFRVVADPTGVEWRVSDITATCALVTIFTMGAFALMAWVRLSDRPLRQAGKMEG